jgi:hypothetical protein
MQSEVIVCIAFLSLTFLKANTPLGQDISNLFIIKVQGGEMRKPVIILVGCVAVLLLVCCIGAAAFIMLGNAGDLVARFMGESELGSVSATLQAAGPTIAAAATSGAPKAPSSATKPAASKTTASSGDPFANAMANAKTATKFRVEFSWVFGGMDKGKYQETPFIDFNGEVDGENSHMTSKGGIMAMMAKDANTSVEVIEAGGKTYMKGTILASDPKAWYLSEDSSTSSFADFASVDAYKDWASGTKSGDIKKARSEQLDGQSCDVYVYDMKSVQNSMLLGLLGSSKDQSDFSAVDKGEMDFWYCGDGFVHKFVLDYEGHDSKDATQKAALKMTWHAWDFGSAAIAVTAPKDYKTMP